MDVYLPVVPDMRSYFGISEMGAQWTLSVYMLVFGLGHIFMGPIANVFGAFRTLWAFVLMYIVGSVMCVLAPTIVWFFVGRVVQAWGSCGAAVLSFAVVRVAIPERHANIRASSIVSGIIGFAPILAPSIGQEIAALFGTWQSTFLFLVVIGLWGFLGLFFGPLREILETKIVRSPRGSRPYYKVMRTREFWSYAVFGTLCMTALFTFFSASRFILFEEFHLKPSYFGAVFGICALGVIGGNMIAPALARRWSLSRALIGTMVVGAMTTTVMAVLGVCAQSLYSFIVTIVLFNSCVGVVLGLACSGALRSLAHQAAYATALYGLQQFVIAFIIGTTIMYFRMYTQVLFGLLMAVLCVVSIGVHVVLRPKV